MDKEAKQGPRRKHLERAAKRGNKRARETLEGPGPFPAGLEYLWRWARELHPARGFGAHGPNPVTWPDLDAWARRTGRDPDPDEARALLEITAVMAYPPEWEG